MENNSHIAEKYQFVFRDRHFVGYLNVYSPVIFPGAQKQKALPIKKGDCFLEIGCGTGVFAICAALDGAEKVVAIDINPDAVANTIENSEIHEVTEKLTVLQGDMFSPQHTFSFHGNQISIEGRKCVLETRSAHIPIRLLYLK